MLPLWRGINSQLCFDTLSPAQIIWQKLRLLKPEASSNMGMCQSAGNESGLADFFTVMPYTVTMLGLQNGR